jgi:hypothetical protein
LRRTGHSLSLLRNLDAEWNTLQEHAVQRQPAAVSARMPQPIFSSSGTSFGSPPSSWLDGTMDPSSFSSPFSSDGNVPIRITDLYDKDETADGTGEPTRRRLNRRIVVPDDDEFNTVLGGGLVPGSLILLGYVLIHLRSASDSPNTVRCFFPNPVVRMWPSLLDFLEENLELESPPCSCRQPPALPHVAPQPQGSAWACRPNRRRRRRA